MSALPVDDVDLVDVPPERVLRLARSYGPLRAVTPAQAPVVAAAAEDDRRVLPRWQRYGEGHHEWAEPRHYSHGRTWVRVDPSRVRGHRGWGSRGQRAEVYTGRPHVNWSSRDHWLRVVVPAAIRLRPEALHTHRGNVTAERLTDYCRHVSLHAHERTGRRCIVRVDRLAELMGCSKSTVQRCQAAAEALGLYVVMSPGRMLTEDETYQVRQRGSCQRGMANEAALVIPDWLPREAFGRPAGGRRARRHDPPTSGRYRNSDRYLSLVPSGSDEQRFAGKNAPPPAAQRPQRKAGRVSEGGPEPGKVPQRRSGRVYDAAALQLARDLTERVSWLRDVPAGRLEIALRRFVRCRLPWSAGDVVEAIDRTNARLARASMTRDLVRNPPALLAAYLRDLDVDADHPRFGMDPADLVEEPISAGRRRNLELLAIHRESGSSRQDPAARDAALARMRAQLAAQRAARENR